jgi:hypothetical protein
VSLIEGQGFDFGIVLPMDKAVSFLQVQEHSSHFK